MVCFANNYGFLWVLASLASVVGLASLVSLARVQRSVVCSSRRSLSGVLTSAIIIGEMR